MPVSLLIMLFKDIVMRILVVVVASVKVRLSSRSLRHRVLIYRIQLRLLGVVGELDDDCAPLLTMKHVKLCRSAAGESGGTPKGSTGKTRQNYVITSAVKYMVAQSCLMQMPSEYEIGRRTLEPESKIKEVSDSDALTVSGLQSVHIHSHCAAAENFLKVCTRAQIPRSCR